MINDYQQTFEILLSHLDSQTVGTLVPRKRLKFKSPAG